MARTEMRLANQFTDDSITRLEIETHMAGMSLSAARAFLHSLGLSVPGTKPRFIRQLAEIGFRLGTDNRLEKFTR